MRHIIAGAVLIAIALAVTFGVATVLQDLAASRTPQGDTYTPPSLAGPNGKPKPAEGAKVFMMSRRMNDDRGE